MLVQLLALVAVAGSQPSMEANENNIILNGRHQKKRSPFPGAKEQLSMSLASTPTRAVATQKRILVLSFPPFVCVCAFSILLVEPLIVHLCGVMFIVHVWLLSLRLTFSGFALFVPALHRVSNMCVYNLCVVF